MFSHIMIGSNDIARSKKFYDALFTAIGGKPGTEVWMPTDYAAAALRSCGSDGVEQLALSGFRFPGHLYEVILRWDRQPALMIRAQHVGPAE